MKITINGKEITLTDEQIATLKEETKKDEEEWTKLGDKYWFLSSYGAEYAMRDTTGIYAERRKRGVYRTEEEAKKADQKRIALATIWAYWEKNCKWEVDYNNAEQNKSYIIYKHHSKEFFIAVHNSLQLNPFLPAYKSEEQAEQALEALRPEYKLLFDVV